MKGKITYRRNGTVEYSIDGRTVTKDEFDAAFVSKDLGAPAAGGLEGWPCFSNAMAVSPDKIAKRQEVDRKNGVTCDFTADGRPILTSPGHAKQYRRMRGMRDRRSFTE